MVRRVLCISGIAMVIGCGSGSTPPANEAPASTAPPAATSPAAASTGTAAPQAAVKIDPKTVDDCKLVAAASTASDPAAASAAQGTGTSERKEAITEVMKQKRPGFRCCFDIWSAKIPEAKLYTKVAFAMVIDAEGKVKSATSQPEEKGPMVPAEVDGCLKDVAATLTFPPSPSGKQTNYTYHFDFKPRMKH